MVFVSNHDARTVWRTHMLCSGFFESLTTRFHRAKLVEPL